MNEEALTICGFDRELKVLIDKCAHMEAECVGVLFAHGMKMVINRVGEERAMQIISNCANIAAEEARAEKK